MVFLFFSAVFCVYILALVVALFFEYPFRSMVRLLICPPKKILRLKKDLAKRLQVDTDDIFDDDMDDDGRETKIKREEDEDDVYRDNDERKGS
jgi:hypothetical protein